MSAIRNRGRAGFTLIELLIVVTILGIVAGLALPNLREAIYRADAVRVVSDMATVRLAVIEMVTTTHATPADSDWGQVPPELVDYLPGGFQFTYKDVEYAWATLDAATVGTASGDGWVEMIHAYRWADPLPASPQGSQGKGKGLGRPTGDGTTTDSGAVDTTDPTAGDLASGSTVGVLWVRYDAGSSIGQALQRHAGTSAFWTPTQMLFVVLQ